MLVGERWVIEQVEEIRPESQTLPLPSLKLLSSVNQRSSRRPMMQLRGVLP